MDFREQYWLSIMLVALLALALARTTLAQFVPVPFTFYIHDNLKTRCGQSAYVVTPPLGTAPVGSSFGSLIAFDDKATPEPDPEVTQIGRARGLYLFNANDNFGPGVQLAWTLQFDSKRSNYGSSTISFVGFHRYAKQNTTISIVGGTGNFQYAQGVADITTYSRVGGASILKVDCHLTGLLIL